MWESISEIAVHLHKILIESLTVLQDSHFPFFAWLGVRKLIRWKIYTENIADYYESGEVKPLIFGCIEQPWRISSQP